MQMLTRKSVRRKEQHEPVPQLNLVWTGRRRLLKSSGRESGFTRPTTLRRCPWKSEEAAKHFLEGYNESMNNCCETLGMERAATQQQVVSAFRKMVLMYHPDRNHSPDAEEKFIQAHQAYEVLANPYRRAEYDNRIFYQEAAYGQTFPSETHTFSDWNVSAKSPRKYGWIGRWPVWAPLGFFAASVGVIYLIETILRALQ
jgi:DnaJ-domain-containing protein 1